MGPVSVTLSTYYVSGFHETGVDATGSDTACLYNDNYCHVASFIDNDLTGIYKVNDHLTTSVTVENLMDRAPPIDPANYAALNYNPLITGRHQSAGISNWVSAISFRSPGRRRAGYFAPGSIPGLYFLAVYVVGARSRCTYT